MGHLLSPEKTSYPFCWGHPPIPLYLHLGILDNSVPMGKFTVRNSEPVGKPLVWPLRTIIIPTAVAANLHLMCFLSVRCVLSASGCYSITFSQLGGGCYC